MEPKYSVLLCNQDYAAYETPIHKWLHAGVKVIWFGAQEEADALKRRYDGFAKAFLLQVYGVDFTQRAIVVDGEGAGAIVPLLERECPMFNAAQYLVEHCKADEHIVVQASAGTGKTTVMIDRIMFLLHTDERLRMSDLYMITFTNDAAGQMRTRLQEMLLRRFSLTGNMRYFRWVEEQAQMNISTIHSFAYSMLKEYGIDESFTSRLQIRGFKHEKRELIKDMMEAHMDAERSIISQAGLPLYKAISLVDQYWNDIAKIGVARREMRRMNWGGAKNAASALFQSMAAQALGSLEDAYYEMQQRSDAVSVNDIIRNLEDVLMRGKASFAGLSMKYLFIDEFQDSDLSQIGVAARFVKLLGTRLFVVGDVKQSIYRFRGATDQAFDMLSKNLREIGAKPARTFILKNNYRTAAGVMNRMDEYFARWGRDGLLRYDGPVLALNKRSGTMKMIAGSTDEEEENGIIAKAAAEQLDALVERIEKGGAKASEKSRVVMLTRTNRELKDLGVLLRARKIPAMVLEEGSFYASEAVRDFYAMICSYMFADEPKHVFGYLLTPYAGEIEPMDMSAMEQLGGDNDMLIDYLSHFLRQTNWEKYYKDFRLRPVMAVVKRMLDNEPILDSFILLAKKRYMDRGWEEKRCCAAVRADAARYQANLEKLTEVLQRSLGGDKVSLYDVYRFLQLQIATNRTESEPDVETQDDYRTIRCMTVHKSKGLEFDTVIIPYMNRQFPSRVNTEIIIDPLTREVGWNVVTDKKYPDMKNDLYDKLKGQEVQRIREEETRILYVAMTRAINNLICIVQPAKDTQRWSYLIEEVGVDAQ